MGTPPFAAGYCLFLLSVVQARINEIHGKSTAETCSRWRYDHPRRAVPMIGRLLRVRLTGESPMEENDRDG